MQIPRIKNFEEFKYTVDKHEKRQEEAELRDSCRLEDTRLFLSREYKLLAALKDKIIHHINTGTNAVPNHLRGDLEECDYLYLDFPDYKPGILEKPDLSFFKRILYSISYYSRYLHQGIEHLNRYRT
ncbi:MAG: hypothetical protein ACLFST_14330, partial [Spirochaetia bacterium]